MRGRTLVGLLAALACSAACRPVSAPAAIRLAATLPLSASNASEATAWQRGYQRAVDEVNAAGGLMLASLSRRVRVELTVRDDAGDLARAEAGAADLLGSGAHVLLATPGPVRMVAQAAVARQHERPYVIPTDAAPDVLATRQPWVVAAGTAGRDGEASAYEAARATLQALTRATAFDGEALRRALEH